MCRDFAVNNNFRLLRSRQHQRQRGISLILVLFLLVVVGLLAAAMAQLNRGSANAVGLEIQSTRALFAAESGAQIAAMKLFPINSASTPTCPATLFAQAFTANGLTGCSATATCSAPVTVSGHTIYTLTSVGTCGAGNDLARRQITVGLRDFL